eukprot:scaffold301_cov243-Pinguiococcus_pyrenoidosus.AAC.2
MPSSIQMQLCSFTGLARLPSFIATETDMAALYKLLRWTALLPRLLAKALFGLAARIGWIGTGAFRAQKLDAPGPESESGCGFHLLALAEQQKASFLESLREQCLISVREKQPLSASRAP